MMPMDLRAMETMHARDVVYLVYHTAAAPNGVDQSAAQINAYHRSLGWSSIGYHFLIRRSGEVESGRPITKQGAHVLGLNDRSIGICYAGHGDITPLTPAQFESGVDLGVRLAKIYDISIENIVGHREINSLVDAGQVAPRFRTAKSCPGVRISMWKIRKAIAGILYPAPPPIEIHAPDVPDVAA